MSSLLLLSESSGCLESRFLYNIAIVCMFRDARNVKNSCKISYSFSLFALVGIPTIVVGADKI